MKYTLLFLIVLLSSFSAFSQENIDKEGVTSHTQNVCAENICLNKKVLDNYDRIGLVTHIDGNSVTYFAEGKEHTTSALSDLSPEIEQLGKIKKGMYTLWNHERTSSQSPSRIRLGLVVAVFENGQVKRQVKSNYEWIERAVNYVDLIPEVNEHPQYNKTDYYSYRGTEGKIKHFFKNGELHFGRGLIVMQVAEEIDEFGGYKKGTRVIGPNGLRGTIKKIYSDGSTVCGVERQELDLSNDSIKTVKENERPRLYGIAEANLAVDTKYWAREMSLELRKGTPLEVTTRTNIVVHESHLSSVQQNVRTFIETELSYGDSTDALAICKALNCVPQK